MIEFTKKFFKYIFKAIKWLCKPLIWVLYRNIPLPKMTTKRAIVLIVIILGCMGYTAYWTSNLAEGNPKFQSPIHFQNFIRIEPTSSNSLIKQAQAQEISTVEQKVREAFGPNADMFMRISKAESGRQAGQKGWNCMYGKVSRACNPEDRDKAWSVDCGFLQVNVYGTICPPEMYDIDYNIQAAKGKLERQGKNAWIVCKFKLIQC